MIQTCFYIGFIACPDLPKPDYGHKFVADRFPKGNVATFGCDDHYKLKGRFNRVCDLKTGRWSGEQPSCQSRSNKTGMVQFDLYLIVLTTKNSKNIFSSPINVFWKAKGDIFICYYSCFKI